MKHHIGGLVLIVALAACGSKDTKQAAPEPAGGAAGPGLWALAPADAVAGFVVREGVIGKLYATLAEVERVAKAQPAAAELYAMLRRAVPTNTVDIFDRAAAEAWGVDVNKGFAIFFDADMEVIAGTLPVKGLDVLAKASGKESRMVGDRKVLDTSDGDVCTEAAGYVLCSRDLETIDAALDNGANSPLAKKVAALPPHRRGDLELVLDTQQVRELREGLAAAAMVVQNPGLLTAAARFDGGVLTLNVSMQAKLAMLTLLAPSAAPKSMQGLDRGAVGVTAWHLDLRPLIAQANLPATLPIAEGIDLRRDMIDQLSGHFAIVTRGTGLGSGELALGLLEEEPARKALPALCKLMEAQLPQAKITQGHSGCTAIVTLPPEVPRDLAGDSFVVSLEVRDSAIWATFGDAKPVEGVPGASSHTARLFDGAQLLMWGRSFDPMAHAETRQAFDVLLNQLDVTSEQRAYIDAARWALAHIAELGVSVRERDGWYEQTVVVATYAADPEDVYRAYEAAVAKDLQGDHAGYRAAMKALAGKTDTLAGQQAAIVEAGAPPFGAASGVLAAIAIPAFVKYMRKSKAAEARVGLTTLHIAADSHLADKGSLPAAVGPTPPPGACCKAGGDRCAPDAKLWQHPSWQALGFAVSDPHYYSYQFQKDGDGFTVRAIGDLDCDGVFSTFEMYGGGDGKAPAGIFSDNELE